MTENTMPATRKAKNTKATGVKTAITREYERTLREAGVTPDDMSLLRELARSRQQNRTDQPMLSPTRTFL